MLNKLGYIELYISKTRIYRSFSEVPCHLNQCKLPFIYRTVRNHFNLLSFVINTSKSIDTSQFLERHIPFIYRILWTSLKAINISQFRYRASAPLFLLYQSNIYRHSQNGIIDSLKVFIEWKFYKTLFWWTSFRSRIDKIILMFVYLYRYY